jgi:isopropylmalate/homocitrate/citramalate synthase
MPVIVNASQLNTAFEGFKDIADMKKEVTDADLEALMDDELMTALVRARD